MSTKTLRKRIALVAVSAMGFGLLSAAPSSAAVSFASITNAGPVRVNGVAVDVMLTGAAGSDTVVVNTTTAQRLLGHSDPRVTMGIYTQVLDSEIDDVGLLLSKAAGF